MSSTQTAILAVVGVLAGFAVGSFICVVIERLPVLLDEPNRFGDLYDTRPWGEVLGGSSRCSSCESPIKAYDKIPFLSWILLRGRCRTCGQSIPGFHPLVELAVPAIGAVMVWQYGWGWRTLPVLWLVPIAVAVAAIDLRTYIVPTRLIWPAFAVALILSGIAVAVEGEPRWLFGGLLGILTLAGPLFVIWFALPGGMGFGDVRLTVLLGWTVGFATIEGSWVSAVFLSVATLALAAVLGLVLGIVGLAARGRQAKVPFGPSLSLAALVVIAVGHRLLEGFEIV